MTRERDPDRDPAPQAREGSEIAFRRAARRHDVKAIGFSIQRTGGWRFARTLTACEESDECAKASNSANPYTVTESAPPPLTGPAPRRVPINALSPRYCDGERPITSP